MTTKTALICGRYLLPVKQGEVRKVGEGRALGYYEYINSRTLETGKNLLCVQHLLRMLPTGLSVIEPFGGVGAFSALIQGQVEPRSHKIYEIDEPCLSQLEFAFADRAGVEVSYGNAHDLLGTERADLYVCDFPFMTIKRYEEWGQEWRRMTAQEPQAILWMDGAVSYLHLHTDNYSRLSGMTVTRDPLTYAHAMSAKLYEDTGYSIVATAYSHACSYFLAKKGAPREISIVKFPAGSGEKGYKWVR